VGEKIKNKTMQNPSVKYGLLAGFIGIILQTFTYSMGGGFMATWWVGLLILLVLLITYIVLSLRIRKEQEGFITFKEAFVKIFLMCLLAGVLSTLFGMLLFHVIDSAFPQKFQEALVEKTSTMMENMGAPQEKIDEVIEKMKTTDNFSIASQVKSFFYGVAFYAVFALIMAASIKKVRPFMDDAVTKA
jgi:hypothetical protein